MSQTGVVFRWTLTYSGKEKTYQVTEARLVDGDWITLRSSSWESMTAALNHIEVTNKQRENGGR